MSEIIIGGIGIFLTIVGLLSGMYIGKIANAKEEGKESGITESKLDTMYESIKNMSEMIKEIKSDVKEVNVKSSDHGERISRLEISYKTLYDMFKTLEERINDIK